MTRRDWLGAMPTALIPLVSRHLTAQRPVIESVAVYSTEVGRRSWVLCELTTADGLTGLGDASANETVPKQGAEVMRSLFETLRGRTPFEVERLRRAAIAEVKSASPRARRPTVAACSAVEQCMWDLQGKALGLPCSELFGGRLRAKIRNYANINRATRGADRTAAGFAANARRAAQAGFDAVKLAPFDHLPRNEPDAPGRAEEVDRGIGFVRAVREAIGPERDVLIDGHGRFDAAGAIEVGRRLAPYNLYWMEEMCPSAADLARFRESTDVQTAGGEGIWGVDGFSPYIQAGAVDTVMPDVKFCGGMYELKKIAAMAEGSGLLCSPHGPASPVGNMAAAHVCASMPNFDILEFAFGEVSWRSEVVLPAEEIRDGHLIVPDRPGIGYEMNPERWKRYEA